MLQYHTFTRVTQVEEKGRLQSNTCGLQASIRIEERGETGEKENGEKERESEPENQKESSGRKRE